MPRRIRLSFAPEGSTALSDACFERPTDHDKTRSIKVASSFLARSCRRGNRLTRHILGSRDSCTLHMLRCTEVPRPMFASGHLRRFRDVRSESAFHPIATKSRTSRYVAEGPNADKVRCSKTGQENEQIGRELGAAVSRWMVVSCGQKCRNYRRSCRKNRLIRPRYEPRQSRTLRDRTVS